MENIAHTWVTSIKNNVEYKFPNGNLGFSPDSSEINSQKDMNLLDLDLII